LKIVQKVTITFIMECMVSATAFGQVELSAGEDKWSSHYK